MVSDEVLPMGFNVGFEAAVALAAKTKLLHILRLPTSSRAPDDIKYAFPSA